MKGVCLFHVLFILICANNLFSQCISLDLGNQYFDKKDYKVAKAKYEEAIYKCPNITATEKQKVLAKIKECEKRLNCQSAITSAGKLFDEKKYELAKKKYEEALMCPNITATEKQKVSAKIKECDEKKKSCKDIIAFAKELFIAKKYELAKKTFEDARISYCSQENEDIKKDIDQCINRCDEELNRFNCYEKNYKEAEEQLKAKKYDKALEAFEKVKICLYIPENANVDEKIAECIEHIQKIPKQGILETTLWGRQGTYSGWIQYGQANGKGIFRFNEDLLLLTVEAIFHNGIPRDSITVIYRDNSKYTGPIMKDSLTASGKFIFPDQSIYTGNYTVFKPSGKNGVQKYPNGDEYRGDFEDGKKQGQGTIIAGDGHDISGLAGCKRYTGEWQNDFKSGYGCCFDSDGKLIHTGTFKNNIPLEKYPNRVQQLNMQFVYVKGGTFILGKNSQDAGHSEVFVTDFEISIYEVTVQQYRTFCEAAKRPMPQAPPWGWADDYPIVNVTLADAQAFCEWNNCRLPTEAEWEYAARGGDSSHNTAYSGSNNLREVAYFQDNSKLPHKVGGKKQNELGLYDMSGNVSEWCLPVEGSMEHHTNKAILKGGSWATTEEKCRIYIRTPIPAAYREWLYDIGFRVVRK